MTVKTRLEVRRGEIRSRLAEIGAADEVADGEEMRSLKTEYEDVENKLAALAISEDGQGAEAEIEDRQEADGEGRELATILTRARLSNYVERAASGSPLDGAERELNQAFKMPAGAEVKIPLAMLAEDPASEVIEDRADAVTELAITTVQRPESWLARVFAGTASEFLGLNRKTVSGQAAFPVITGGATGETVAKGAAKDAEEATITVSTMDPKRISARYVFAKEDAARLGPAVYEEALRADLRMAISTAMDKEIIGGGTGINGFVGDLTADPDAALSDPTGANGFVNALFGLIDGRYALTETDLRFICRPDFYRYLITLALSVGSTDALFVADYLKLKSVPFKSTAHVAEITGQAGESYIYACLAQGKAGAAIHAVWDSMELIRDPFTDASKGRVAITAVGLHNFKVIRADNFAKMRVAAS